MFTTGLAATIAVAVFGRWPSDIILRASGHPHGLPE